MSASGERESRVVVHQPRGGGGHPAVPDLALERSFAAAGELGALMRALDWSRTALGPIERWPRSLKSHVCTILEMPTPAIIFWGPELSQLYNQGYATIMGPRHPRYLGAPYPECWPDTYPVVDPWMQRVLAGEAVQVTDTHFLLTRHGFAEEAYFTFSFSPLRDDAGEIAGVFQPVVEVTASVLAARRRETLRSLSACHGPGGPASLAEALASDPKDLPFALVYALDERGAELHLVAASGVDARSAGAVFVEHARRVVRAGLALQVDDVGAALGHEHRGPWPEATRAAVALPLRRSADQATFGVAVFGLSPRLRFDDAYREFVEAIARELAVSMSAERAKVAEARLLAREQLALREAELQKEHLTGLLSQAPIPMALLRGPDLVIELANVSACRIWRRELADVIDRPVFEALPELRGQVFEELLLRVYRTGAPFVGKETKAEFVPPGRGGAAVHAYVTFVYAPLRSLSGEVDGVLVLGMDVTEQVLAREQVETLRAEAEAASKAKDEFLAVLGHELRNPLAPILTALHVMGLRGGAVAQAVERERTLIERQARHLVRLVDDLLDVSRITRGRVELRREELEVRQVVERALELAGPLLEQRLLDLVVDVPPEGLVIDGDPVRCAQVLSNLLTNAAKCTEPGGRVTVSAALSGGWVELRVRDTGIGIEPELLPRIFDMFAQAPQAIDRTAGGLGLGLTIVRSLVELHGGTVEATSDGPGRGSEFVVRLPLAAGAERRPATSAGGEGQRLRPPTPPAAARRVLVVDDNVDAARTLAELLEVFGYVACVAHDGPAALRLADDFDPHAALLDIGLPAMDGYELARRLRQRLRARRLGLIAVTGYGLDVDQRRSKEAGFDAHLVKPVDVDRLEGLLRALTGVATG